MSDLESKGGDYRDGPPERRVGERFNIAKYDVLATISSIEDGHEVMVLGNSSTHFLVVLRDHDDYVDGARGGKYATLLASFRYDDEYKVVLAAALNRAVSEAVKR